MKRKVLLLTLIMIMLVSNFVFADSINFTLKPYWVYYSGYIYASNYPISVNNSSNYLTKQDGNLFDRYLFDGSKWVLNATGRTLSKTDSIVASSHDIYNTDTLDIFFQLPKIPPIVQGMAGALQKLLSTILPNLPIILGMLVLAIGLRKAYRMLSVSLKGA